MKSLRTEDTAFLVRMPCKILERGVMNNLLQQIVKFGLVGAVCFVIDYVVGLLSMNVILLIIGDANYELASVLGAAVGFAVSVIANYIMSFKFVFERKQDLDRRYEFIIFLILSLIGMVINSFLIWLGVGPLYRGISYLSSNVGKNVMYTISKVFATAIVMVYNFITRKVFLEQKK